ncbi:anti-sigma factor antagonist [Streptomyces dangxiongensis]|uniref:Anti-sigma factor antagonist n=1 Tax=Streptomyces dangxiongensis TaxID=1442032 RepID=A0A3G2JMH1_9ACTN|nr:STAS domain-containing protein [Streptomyces dangxiongensis]AYN42781.1 anti-sigma factor antagonist [Streptomyces dangxiongensis]
MPDFTVTVAHDADETVIAAAGELDMSTCPKVAEAIAALPAGNTSLRLDLSGISFMDSMGLNLLLTLRRRLEDSGGRLVLTGVHQQPSGLLRLTGAYSLFDITEAADNLAGSGR